MKSKFLKIALAAALLAPLASQAQAEGSSASSLSNLRVRARVAYAHWENKGEFNTDVGSDGVAAKDKVVPEVDASYFFTKNFATEFVITYPQSIHIYKGGTGGDELGAISALPISLVAQYHFYDTGAFRPYVGAGFNLTQFTERKLKITNPDDTKVDTSSLGFVGQVGLDYMFNSNWGLNVDLKYTTMRTHLKEQLAGDLGTLYLNPWMPAIGLTYQF